MSNDLAKKGKKVSLSSSFENILDLGYSYPVELSAGGLCVQG